MKISEELCHLYRGIRREGWNHGSWKLIADALQQAVAENLELQHQLSPQHRVMLINGIKRCLACDWNESTDWFAKADKLLRNRHD